MSEGLYRGASEDSFKDASDIKREAYLNSTFPNPVLNLPERQPLDFDYWTNRMIERREAMKLSSPESPRTIEIALPETSFIAFIGDIHAGAEDVAYEQVWAEVNAICETPNAYVVGMGDWIDGMFWGEGQMKSIEQVPEQIMFMQSLHEKLGSHNKLLAGFRGDHDTWLEKMGGDAYSYFAEKTGAFLCRGETTMKLDVNGINYIGVLAHQLPGSSMYTDTHPERRAARFGRQGADFYIGAHTHRKGVDTGIIDDINGAREVIYGSCGPYKKTDSWLKKKGYTAKEADALGGFAICFNSKERWMASRTNILKGLDEFVKLQS